MKARNDSPQNVIDSYRKRQQMMPFLIGGLAVLLVAVGVIILVVWLSGPDRPAISLFASKTPTPTDTATPTPITPTATASLTPTVTDTPAPTDTATPSAPFEYTVKENDNCWQIAQTFNVELEILLALNNFGGGCPISPGDRILIPAPNTTLPTATLIPTDLPRGTRLDYIVRQGDTIQGIAAFFNTTVDSILADNKIKAEDANNIEVGQKLSIRYGLATATPTTRPTSTSAVTATPPAAPESATATSAP